MQRRVALGDQRRVGGQGSRLRRARDDASDTDHDAKMRDDAGAVTRIDAVFSEVDHVRRPFRSVWATASAREGVMRDSYEPIRLISCVIARIQRGVTAS